jgi:hypothetical protein
MTLRAVLFFCFVLTLGAGALFEAPSSQDFTGLPWQAVFLDRDETDESKALPLCPAHQADCANPAPLRGILHHRQLACQSDATPSAQIQGSSSLVPRAPPVL